MTRQLFDVSAADISRALADRAPVLCQSLLPQGRKLGAEWVVGSTAGERGRSMKVHLAGSRAGVWSDFSTGDAGDALDLARAVLRTDMRGAIEWARAWLGMPADQIRVAAQSAPQVDRERGPDTLARIEQARCIWRQSAPIAGTMGESYLRGIRCIDLASWPASIRFHPRLSVPPGLIFPGIVLPVQRADGEFCGVWRTVLDPRTGDKAALVDGARYGKGDIRGGSVRLTPLASSMTIGAGLETCLSVLVADPSRAVLMGLSDSFMTSVELPATVRHMTLLEENDAYKHGRRSSQDACARLRDRLLFEGRRVETVRPPAGFKDFNDVLRAPATVRAA